MCYIRLLEVFLKLFEFYPTNSNQKVVINCYISNSTLVLTGVPQVSVLGPTLFVTYNNTIEPP